MPRSGDITLVSDRKSTIPEGSPMASEGSPRASEGSPTIFEDFPDDS